MIANSRRASKNTASVSTHNNTALNACAVNADNSPPPNTFAHTPPASSDTPADKKYPAPAIPSAKGRPHAKNCPPSTNTKTHIRPLPFALRCQSQRPTSLRCTSVASGINTIKNKSAPRKNRIPPCYRRRATEASGILLRDATGCITDSVRGECQAEPASVSEAHPPCREKEGSPRRR